MLAVLLLFLSSAWANHMYHHPHQMYLYCGDGWEFFKGRCFRYGTFISNQRKSWFHGEANCQKLGGHLATIRTYEEFQKLNLPRQGQGLCLDWLSEGPFERLVRRKDPSNDSYVMTEGGTGYVETHSSGNNKLECQYLSSSNCNYDCTSNNINGCLCSPPAINCPPSTSDFSNSQCTCKKGFIDHWDTFLRDNKTYGPYTKGAKCYSLPSCRHVDSNVVFLVDSSDTTAEKKLWAPIKRFINTARDLLSPSMSRLEVMPISEKTFNRTADMFRLRKDWAPGFFNKKLPKQAELGSRPIAKALKTAFELFEDDTSNKNRAVILITTGPITGQVNGAQAMRYQLERLHRSSCEVFVVGVQNTMDKHEDQVLEWVRNDPTRFFAAKNMDSADMEQVLNRMCIPMILNK